MFRAIILAALFAVFVKNSQAFPLHASCRIDWAWPKNNCSEVETRIISEIKKLNTTDCGSGEKCRYALKTYSDSKLTATHTTPVKKYVDDLTFNFTPNKTTGCSVRGYSRSETWYAVLDYGTNYCNLHNLIEGAGLDKWPGYTEKTSNSVCTQYTSANCEKY